MKAMSEQAAHDDAEKYAAREVAVRKMMDTLVGISQDKFNIIIETMAAMPPISPKLLPQWAVSMWNMLKENSTLFVFTSLPRVAMLDPWALVGRRMGFCGIQSSMGTERLGACT
jgi:hypothetical protein